MSKFDDYLKKENERAKSSDTFNANERIDKFRSFVADLYSKIENEWLKTYIDSGAIRISDSNISIHEERLGNYQMVSKSIEFGGKRITLQPIGTIMIGTDARIDMVYRAKEVMIVRVGENVEGFSISITENGKPVGRQEPAGKPVWKYVNKKNRTSYITLNANSFQNLIMELTNETC